MPIDRSDRCLPHSYAIERDSGGREGLSSKQQRVEFAIIPMHSNEGAVCNGPRCSQHNGLNCARGGSDEENEEEEAERREGAERARIINWRIKDGWVGAG